jgi:PleD family two-component response regulator
MAALTFRHISYFMDCKDLRDQSAEDTAPASPLRVLAAVSDLMFVSKISAAAKQAGCAVEFFRDPEILTKAVAGPLCLVIVDLNNASVHPLELIASLKANPSTRDATILAYLSHVQHELKRKAEKAGSDLVLPRSAFSQNLYEILRQRSCHL